MGCRACWCPLTVAVLMLLGVVVPYVIASSLGHVASFWPYVSDSGVKYPERNIFAQFLDMATVFGVATIFLRFLVLREVARDAYVRLRCAALWIGCVSSMALTLVGNFQEDLGDYVHPLGALLMFVLGAVYIFLDTYITIRLRAQVKNGVVLTYIRFVIACFTAAFIILFFVGKFISEHLWQADLERHLQWSPTDPGYSLHVLGSVSEWVVGLMFVFYFFTLVKELSHYSFSVTLTERATVAASSGEDIRRDREGNRAAVGGAGSTAEQPIGQTSEERKPFFRSHDRYVEHV